MPEERPKIFNISFTEEDKDFSFSININEAAQGLADKLNKEISRGNDEFSFIMAIIFSAVKIGLISIPFAGQIINPIVTGALYLFLFGKGWFLTRRVKIIYWVFGLISEVPLINIIPFDIGVVLYAWYLVKKRMHKAEEKMAILDQLSAEEITVLNTDIGMVEEEIYTSTGALNEKALALLKKAKQLTEQKEAMAD